MTTTHPISPPSLVCHHISNFFGTHFPFQGGSSRRGLKKAGTTQEADVDTPRRLCIQSDSINGKGKAGKGKSGKSGISRGRELSSGKGKGGKGKVRTCSE